ncbi:alpha/beta fold hydrolase [Acidobacteria bacterium AH-259-L09]|nr:alpha/beta fold hydrolase [Acidobacteria bacterium AH-259-L09]
MPFLFQVFVPLFLCGLILSAGGKSPYETVTFETSDGAVIEADYFEGTTGRVVVFAHGAVFDKESWHVQARSLQERGISSLCINFRGYGNSLAGETNEKHQDVLGALKYLGSKGVERIGLVGGSMGGAEVNRALQYTHDPKVDKVLLLAPAGGEALENQSRKKLFVVAEGDFAAPVVRSMYEASSEPKELKVYSGSAHAQHLFKTEHGDDLSDLIIRFMKD